MRNMYDEGGQKNSIFGYDFLVAHTDFSIFSGSLRWATVDWQARIKINK